MLVYVETGIKFTNDFGDINESFYKSLATTFVESLTLMKEAELLFKFEERVEKIVEDTQGVGWGFHDCLVQAWMDFYPGDDGESFDGEQREVKDIGKIIKLENQ